MPTHRGCCLVNGPSAVSRRLVASVFRKEENHTASRSHGHGRTRMSMCGESGLIRERLQGRREQSCWQLLEGGTGNHATRCSACASAIACIAAFLRRCRHEWNVSRALQPARLYTVAEFALCGHRSLAQSLHYTRTSRKFWAVSYAVIETGYP